MSKVVKKTLNIIIDVIVILILIVSALVVTLSLTSKASGVPNIFGVAPLAVESDSMKDTFVTGDLIFSSVVNHNDGSEASFEKGDIITFYQVINGEARLNTHRIVDIVKDSNNVYYKTQGDNKKTNPDPDPELKSSEDILAKYNGFKIGGVGNFFSFIRTQLGFFLVILLPMIIFFVYEAIRVIMNIIAYNKEKVLEDATQAIANAELTEEQKKRAIEEYLAQQNKKTDSEPTVQTPAEGVAAEAEESDT